MKRYLKTAMSEKLNISLEDSNMYLAEDRIMCLGIHALGYTLDYLPDAESQVDPVTSLTRLLGQRRRWINGSWFAFNYVSEHAY
jgi:chitin synthase